MTFNPLPRKGTRSRSPEPAPHKKGAGEDLRAISGRLFAFTTERGTTPALYPVRDRPPGRHINPLEKAPRVVPHLIYTTLGDTTWLTAAPAQAYPVARMS